MTKIHPESVDLMAPIAEVPRLEAEASRNEEATGTTRYSQRPVNREILETLAYSVPKFDGKLEDWLIFKHFYVHAVHNVSEFTDTEKLLFLRHCVVGELGEQVARIGISGANYSCAWAMIEGKFENKERELKAKHMSLLLDLPEMPEESAEGLSCLIENTRKHLQCLRMINVKIPHDFLVVSLAKKLDQMTQFEWKTSSKDWEPTIEEMLAFLSEKVNFLTEITRIVEQKRQRGEVVAKCCYCNHPDHYTHQCYLFTSLPLEERVRWVEQSGLCKKCFRDHYSSQCKFRNCYICEKEHSILLHQELPANPPPSMPLNPPLAYPQGTIVYTMPNMHSHVAHDEGTSDEGISESGDSLSSQEEKYEYRQEIHPQLPLVSQTPEVTPMQEIPVTHEMQSTEEIPQMQAIPVESEVETVEEDQIEHYIDHEGVFRGNEDVLSPEVSKSEKQNKQIENGAYSMHHHISASSGPVIVKDLSKETHIGVSQAEENGIHLTTAVNEEQYEESENYESQDQITISSEAADLENQNLENHENICQGDDNAVLPEDASQQENICQSEENLVPLEDTEQEQNDLQLGACGESQNVLSPEEDDQEITIICQKTQDLKLHPATYQEPTYEPQVDVCQQGGQNIIVPRMVYQQAQYVAPPEVAYQVDGQTVMSHSMVYPQYAVVPSEEAYQAVSQNITPNDMVYQPMPYMCGHMAAYPMDRQMVMPPGMMYSPQSYVVPSEEAYQEDEQNMVLPGSVYQPVQYIDSQVDQNQAISTDPLMYGIPYYPAPQVFPQEAMSALQHNAIHPHSIHQQAMQQPHIIQQQHVIQQQQVMQAAMQPQHVMHQQHIILQQQQQQQPQVIRQDLNRLQRPSRQEHIVIQEANAVNQQEGNALLQEQLVELEAVELDDQIAGRLRPDAEPFEPNGPSNRVVVMAPDGQVYIMSRLNYNAQEFVPGQGIQPRRDQMEGEVKSKIKQYLSRVAALLV